MVLYDEPISDRIQMMNKTEYLIAKKVWHYLLDDMDMSFDDVEDLFFKLSLAPQISGRVMLSVEELKEHLPEYVVEGMISKHGKK
tara:strand:+ start:174 stop:428 length:255 start_codon:yes stop_codon:yes gene_type:complete